MESLQLLQALIDSGAEAIGLNDRARLDDEAVYFVNLKVSGTQNPVGESLDEYGNDQPVYEGCWQIDGLEVPQFADTTIGAALKVLELVTQNIAFKAMVLKEREIERNRMLKEAEEIF